MNNTIYLKFTLCCSNTFRAQTNYFELQSCKSDNITVVQPCPGRKQSSNWNLGTFCPHCNGYVLLLKALGLVTDLPHSNNGVSDEDKKDDERLHKGGDGLLTLLEPGQHLEVRAAKIKSVT